MDSPPAVPWTQYLGDFHCKTYIMIIVRYTIVRKPCPITVIICKNVLQLIQNKYFRPLGKNAIYPSKGQARVSHSKFCTFHFQVTLKSIQQFPSKTIQNIQIVYELMAFTLI